MPRCVHTQVHQACEHAPTSHYTHVQVASYQAERFGLRAGGALDAWAVPETNPVWSDSEMSVDSGRGEASGESKEGVEDRDAEAVSLEEAHELPRAKALLHLAREACARGLPPGASDGGNARGEEDSNRFDGRRVEGAADEDVTQAQRRATADWCMTSSSFVDEGLAVQWAPGDMSTGGLSLQVGAGARRPLEESDTDLRQKGKLDTEAARAGTGLRQLRELGSECAGGAVNLEVDAVANAALRARVHVSLSLARALTPREEQRDRE